VTGPRDRRYLTYIAESIELIERYTRQGRDTFVDDPQVSDAVLHRLETLAEAASRLSDELKARHPSIGWRDISDFRNVVAHAYFDVELPRVWEVLTDDLPALKTAVEEELRGGGSSGGGEPQSSV
jgi:uncharacterized protein with HEPN domain